MNTTDASSLLTTFSGLLGTATTILVTIGVLVVIYAAVRYAFAKEEDDRTAFRKMMINGLIAVAVIFSIFGIVKILQNTVFGQGTLGNTTTQQGLNIPTIQ